MVVNSIQPMMESNPYLQHQPEQNPYLKAASQDAATARIMQNLTQLLPEKAIDSVPDGQSQSFSRSGYRSATNPESPSEPMQYVADSTTHPSPHANPYRSPQETLQAEEMRQRQEHARQQQEALRQQQLAQAEAQRAAATRRALEKQARQFLATLEQLDPLEGDRMWFEAFADLCPSRLDAAIEFIQTMNQSR